MQWAQTVAGCGLVFLMICPPTEGNDQAQDGWYVRLINPSDSGVRLAARVWVNRNAVALILMVGPAGKIIALVNFTNRGRS